MSSELLQVEMGKRERERERERERKGWRGDFITPHTEKSRCSSKTRKIWGNPRNSGKSRESGKNPDTPRSAPRSLTL
jgi:hypothetical protein